MSVGQVLANDSQVVLFVLNNTASFFGKVKLWQDGVYAGCNMSFFSPML